MSKFESHSRYLTWLMALLLSAFAAGCGSGGQSSILGGSGIAALAPTVTATAPLATTPMVAGVEINSKITATFTKDMALATISTSTFTLACPAAVPGTVAYVAASRIAIFAPTANLPAGAICTATLTTGATDTNGIPLASNFTWTFATGAVLDTTPPRVSSTIPANSATDVPINTKVGVTFSEAMDPSTITTTTFTLKQGATAVPGTVTYSGITAVFTPVSTLAASTTYTATITTGTQCLEGVAMAANYTWSWTTAAAADTTAPTVTGTSHANGATNVAINTRVGVTFSEEMDPLTITNVNFTLKETVTGTAVADTMSYSGVSAEFIPASNLAFNTRYTVTVKGGVSGAKDLAGNALANDFVISWTTAAAPDTTAPTVAGTVNADGATNVPINTKVGVTFSEEMDPLTITNATFTIAQEATAVSGTVSYSGVNAVFTPASALAASTTYTATITTGAKDLAGNALAANYSWSFTSSARNYTAWSDQGVVYTAPAGDAYYPSVLYDRNEFGGVATHAMWYTDGAGAAFLVTSSNGTSWSSPATITGLGGRAHHVQVLYDANHFGLGPSGPTYRMWYWDIGASLYDISAIATAESMDGINWVNNTALTQDASAQLVTGAETGWNRGSYGPVYLFYQPSAANSGADPWSYSYIMYYDGTDGSREQTGLAYSADGVFWKAYYGNPVLPHSASPAWDSDDSVYGAVYRDGLGFHFWYSGGVSTPNEGIGYAFSSDGKTWTKNSTPVFQITDGAAYRNSRTYTPSIIDDGSGTLKMYYTAMGAGGAKTIGAASLPP